MKSFLTITFILCAFATVYGQQLIDFVSLSQGIELTRLTSTGAIIPDENGQDVGQSSRLSLGKKMSSHWSLATGIGYACRTYNYIGRNTLRFPNDLVSPPPVERKSTFDNYTQLKTIELFVTNYLYIIPNRLFFAPSIAVEGLLESRDWAIFTITPNEPYVSNNIAFYNRKVNIGGNLAIGYAHPMTNKLSLSASVYTHFNVLKNGLAMTWAEGHYYSFGFQLGASYQFIQ